LVEATATLGRPQFAGCRRKQYCAAQAILQWPTLELGNLDYQVELFQFAGFGLNINEPKLQGQAQVAVDLERALAQVADVTLTSSSLAASGASGYKLGMPTPRCRSPAALVSEPT
jgi:hypothetical protein